MLAQGRHTHSKSACSRLAFLRVGFYHRFFRICCATLCSCLLVFYLIYSSGFALTLERPNVNVDWSKLPDKKAARGAVRYAHNRLFGTVEFRSQLKNLPQWERITRLYAGKSGIDQDFPKVQGEDWNRLKKNVAGLNDLAMLKEVNKFFNRWPYRADIDTYGIIDYWATPAEFIKNSGDCEDYAIIKMFALRQLGIDPEKMRLVILKDQIRNIDHAVLAVYLSDDVYILDSVSQLVLPHSKYGHYRPMVSLNFSYRWAHVPPAK